MGGVEAALEVLGGLDGIVIDISVVEGALQLFKDGLGVDGRQWSDNAEVIADVEDEQDEAHEDAGGMSERRTRG